MMIMLVACCLLAAAVCDIFPYARLPSAFLLPSFLIMGSKMPHGESSWLDPWDRPSTSLGREQESFSLIFICPVTRGKSFSLISDPMLTDERNDDRRRMKFGESAFEDRWTCGAYHDRNNYFVCFHYDNILCLLQPSAFYYFSHLAFFLLLARHISMHRSGNYFNHSRGASSSSALRLFKAH